MSTETTNFAAAVNAVAKTHARSLCGMRVTEASKVRQSWPRTSDKDFHRALQAAAKAGLIVLLNDHDCAWIVTG